MTLNDIKILRKVVRRLVNAEVAYSWRGNETDAETRSEIAREFRLARRQYTKIINETVKNEVRHESAEAA